MLFHTAADAVGLYCHMAYHGRFSFLLALLDYEQSYWEELSGSPHPGISLP